MSSTKTKRIEFKDLKQGDLVWSDHFEAYLIFEEEAEFEGENYFWFKRYSGTSFVLLNATDIYEVDGLLKELM